jgi:hypothetical protein
LGFNGVFRSKIDWPGKVQSMIDLAGTQRCSSLEKSSPVGSGLCVGLGPDYAAFTAYGLQEESFTGGRVVEIRSA